MTNGNHQAFGYGFEKESKNPSYGRGSSNEYLKETIEYKGLTKREYFAAMAMQGLIGQINVHEYSDLAIYSVKAADALINELNKDLK